MRLRPLLLTLALIAIAALVAAALAGARVRAKTTVTITGPNGDFEGKIFSPRGRCLGNRTVVVHKLRGNGYDPANDPVVGSDTSQRIGRHGEWSLGNTGIRNGRFYAIAKKTPFCRVGFSPVIRPS
ncbi:MAG TPA: hypothetical protein VF030_09835 [Solirubrobacterales bacterium]